MKLQIPTEAEFARLERMVYYLILGDQLKKSITHRKVGTKYVRKDDNEIMATCISMILRGAELKLTPQMSLAAFFPTSKGNLGIEAQPALALVRKFYPEAIIYPVVTNIKTTIWVARRKGDKFVPTVYTAEMAQLAGLWGKDGPWKEDPASMIFYKCAMRMIRRFFSDVLWGTAIREDMHEYLPEVEAPSTMEMLETTKGMKEILSEQDLPQLPQNFVENPPEIKTKADELEDLPEPEAPLEELEEVKEVKPSLPSPFAESHEEVLEELEPLEELEELEEITKPTLVQDMKNPSEAQVDQLKKQVQATLPEDVLVEDEINAKIEDLSGLIDEESALTLVARDQGINQIDEIEELTEKINAQAPITLDEVRLLRENQFRDADYYGSSKSKKKAAEDKALQNYLLLIEERSKGNWYDNELDEFDAGAGAKFDLNLFKDRFETLMKEKKPTQTNLEIAQFALWEVSTDLEMDLDCDQSLEPMMERRK